MDHRLIQFDVEGDQIELCGELLHRRDYASCVDHCGGARRGLSYVLSTAQLTRLREALLPFTLAPATESDRLAWAARWPSLSSERVVLASTSMRGRAGALMTP